PAFTARQKGYAAARGDGHVYTPQAIVDGLSHVVGSDRQEIEAAASALRGHSGALAVPMTVSESNGTVRVEVGSAAGDTPKSGGVWLMRVARQRTVAIGRGENSGRTIVYNNVVRSMVKLGDWTGAPASYEASAASADGDGYIVMLQSGSASRPGAILAASKGG